MRCEKKTWKNNIQPFQANLTPFLTCPRLAESVWKTKRLKTSVPLSQLLLSTSRSSPTQENVLTNQYKIHCNKVCIDRPVEPVLLVTYSRIFRDWPVPPSSSQSHRHWLCWHRQLSSCHMYSVNVSANTLGLEGTKEHTQHAITNRSNQGGIFCKRHLLEFWNSSTLRSKNKE